MLYCLWEKLHQLLEMHAYGLETMNKTPHILYDIYIVIFKLTISTQIPDDGQYMILRYVVSTKSNEISIKLTEYTFWKEKKNIFFVWIKRDNLVKKERMDFCPLRI